MLLTQAKFAEYIGVSRATVTHLKKKNQLVWVNNKIDVKNTMQLLMSIGKTFDKDNKLISSNTKKINTVVDDKNLFDSSVSYPTLADADDKKTILGLLDADEQREAKELGVSIFDFENEIEEQKYITSRDKWEIERLKIFYQAMIERTKYHKEKERLVEKQEVEDEYFKVARILRDGFMGLSNRVSYRLIDKKSPFEIKEILDNEIYKILENLSE